MPDTCKGQNELYLGRVFGWLPGDNEPVRGEANKLIAKYGDPIRELLNE